MSTIGIIVIIVLTLICIYLTKTTHTEQEIKKESLAQYQKELNEKRQLIDNVNKEYNKVVTQYTTQSEALKQLNQEIALKQNFNSQLYKVREEEVNTLMEAKRESAEEQIEREIAEWARSAQEAATFNASLHQEALEKNYQLAWNEYTDLTNQVNDYKAKRDAINAEIVRSRAIEEQQDFYKVQLDEASTRDLAVLQSIRNQLSKIDLLDKLEYDNYIAKPVNEMIKRVLQGNEPCGIYKITRLKTGEVYIGQSTNIKNRWQQHAKSAFHCGTISHSTLHTTIEKDGITNFTWEVIEEVSKDKLNEREKYWIKFYDSKRVGLNEKEGG